jgi:hypothetical protein
MAFIKSYLAEVGINHVPAYQVSGRPFASASIDGTISGGAKVEFPYVTRWIYVHNGGAADVRVGFSQNGVLGSNYFVLNNKNSNREGASARLELKVSELWISGSNDVSVCAGLTTIPVSRVSSSTGPSFSGSVGVG